MATETASGTFHVHHQIKIARDALVESEKAWLDETIRDRDHFLARVADAPVRRLRDGQPIFILDGPDDLILVYEENGADIKVLFMMTNTGLELMRAKP